MRCEDDARVSITEALFFLHTRWHFSVFLDWSRVPRGRFFRLAITVFVRENATTTDFGVPFGFLVDIIFPTPARGLFERLF
jgi:hypothetical protein